MTTTVGAGIALAILLLIGLTIFAAFRTDNGQAALKSTAVGVTIEKGAASGDSSPGYSPATVTVVVGVNNTVTWVNGDDAIHTVTADGGSFDSHDLGPGKSFTYTFATVGTFDYHCSYHSWMKGTVIVKP